jgi:hypothetical protein
MPQESPLHCFGNPLAVQRAIEEATPNLDQIAEYRQRKERIEDNLLKARGDRDAILSLVAKNVASEEEAAPQLADLKNKIGRFTEELARLHVALNNAPSTDQIKLMSEKVAEVVGKYPRSSAKLWARTIEANSNKEAMTWEEARALVEMVFSGQTTEGKRLGVYIEFVPGQEGRRPKTFRYRILGHLMDDTGWVPGIKFDYSECVGGLMQKELIEVVSKYAWRCKAPGPP